MIKKDIIIIIVIDDNLDFLKQLSQKGFVTFLSQGKNLTELTTEISNQCDSANEVFINISLISNDSKKRLDYAGIVLMQKLMFEIGADKWNLLSFEKEECILTKHNTQILTKFHGVKVVDYLSFIRAVSNNEIK